MNTRDARQLVLFVAGVLIVLILIATSAVLIVQSRPDNRISQNADTRALFIGNSYTVDNQLDVSAAEIIERLADGSVIATRVSPGGYRVPQHLVDAQTDGTLLNEYLLTGSNNVRNWDLVVIQEQSQIPGLTSDSLELQELYQAAPQLAALAQDAGATVMLYMTWGYRAGDPNFPNIYPDYLSMQSRLTFAYDSLADAMSAPDNPVYVAPVGLGFQEVYNDTVALGANPATGPTLFGTLFAGDGQHPSPNGSYLAALIIAAAYTGEPVSDIDWLPRDVDPNMATYLREVADRVVFGDTYADRRYPWRP